MKPTMAATAVAAIIRHLGQLLAGVLLAQGLVTEGIAQEIAGALATLGLVGWSLWQKKQTVGRQPETAPISPRAPPKKIFSP